MLSHVRIFGNPEVSTQFPECSVMPVTSGSIRELAAMRSGKAQLLKIPFLKHNGSKVETAAGSMSE
jgi:hypothetical protein